MRTFLAILVISLFSCNDKIRNSDELTKSLWTTEGVKLNYVQEDETSYGVATILKFEPNSEFKTLTKEFEFEGDTIFWGRAESGNYTRGTWKKEGKYLVATHYL